MRAALCLALFGALALSAAAGAGQIPTSVPGEVMELRPVGDQGFVHTAGLALELWFKELPELRSLYGEAHLRLKRRVSREPPRPVPPAFGHIAPPGCRRVVLVGQNASWVSNEIVCEGRLEGGKSAELRVTVSRLSPAAVVVCDAGAVELFVGTPRNRIPRVLAAAGANVAVSPMREMTVVAAGCRWLLFWFARPIQGLDDEDVLLLVVPFAPLRAIRPLADGALRLEFAEQKATVALLPVSGVVRPRITETRRWANDGLPREVVQRCDWWAERLANFPVGAEESFSYDARADRVTVRCRFSYLALRKSEKYVAPLPPMLALAAQQGFGSGGSPLKLKLEGNPRDTSLHTIFGPYMVYDDARECAWSLSGLSRYVSEVRSTGPEVGPAREFEQRLAAEVSKVLEAGPLAPWVFQDECFAGRCTRRTTFWDNPAENVYFLAELLDVLPPAVRGKLRSYLAQYAEKYPPEKVAAIAPTEGARREFYYVTEQFLSAEQREPLPPPLYNIYGAFRLFQATGRKPNAEQWAAACDILARHVTGRDWATLFAFQGRGEQWPAVVACNRNFAGLVGMARLARVLGDAEAERVALWQLAQCAALRFALGRYRRQLYDIGKLTLPADPAWQVKAHVGDWRAHLVSYHFTKPEHDIDQVYKLDQFEVATGDYNPRGWAALTRAYQLPFRYITPELARFLADHLKQESQRHVQVVAEYQPDWYASWAEATIGSEHNVNLPCDAYTNFVARAWILGEPAGKLRKLVDVPYLARGDYYYMHKLAEVARAYRGMRWEKLAQ